MDDLANIGPEYSSHECMQRFEKVWGQADQKAKHSLMIACFKTAWLPFVTAIVPRLLFTVCMFSTPFLVQEVLKFLADPDPAPYAGGGIVGANALAFTGIAFNYSAYFYLTNRTGTLVRAMLIGQVLKKNLRLPLHTAKDAASFTLITADVEGVFGAINRFHDVWISVPELGLALYFVYRSIGVAFWIPFLPVIVIITIGYFVGNLIGPAAMAWNQAIQTRVAQTAGLLGQMKGVKMLGLERIIENFINSLRDDEIVASKKQRLLKSVSASVQGNMQNVSPLFMVIGGFYWTIWRDGLDATSVFSALAFTYLLVDPTWQINSFWEEANVLFAAFQRIQEFLNLEEHVDPRKLYVSGEDEKCADVDWQLNMDNVTVATRDGDSTILQDLNLTLPTAKLTMVSGPVGSGKSVLLKTLLGETKLNKGKLVTRTTNIAYCDQAPWLPDVSIKDAIVAECDFDESRYQKVLDVCSLKHDIGQMNDGDSTKVGLNGAKLSGGQKQRIALARAVYSFSPVLVCDDVLSALDTTTAEAIFSSVFSSSGMLRSELRTVILATHAVQFLKDADQIIILDDSQRATICAEKDAIGTYAQQLQFTYTASPTQEDTAIDKEVNGLLDGIHAEVSKISNFAKGTDFSLYRYLFQSVPAWLIALFFFGCVIQTLIDNYFPIYLRIWVGKTNPNNNLYMAGLIIITAAAIPLRAAAIYIMWMLIMPIISAQCTRSSFTPLCVPSSHSLHPLAVAHLSIVSTRT